MRLRPEEIERIVDRLLAEWKSRKLATFKSPESAIRTRMIDVFTKELRVEDEVHREVEKILSKYEKEFEKGTLDRRKMFQMVKNQLVKEKKAIL